jgi:hypothetical protein
LNSSISQAYGCFRPKAASQLTQFRSIWSDVPRPVRSTFDKPASSKAIRQQEKAVLLLEPDGIYH